MINSPTITLKTFGCRLNQAESAAMIAALEAAGFVTVGPKEEADVCIVHGCAVTAAAMRDMRRTLRGFSKRQPRPLTVLAGCPAEADLAGEDDRALADLVVSQAGKWQLPARIAEALGMDCAKIAPADFQEPHLPRFPGARAWLRVQDGCDFHCAYCIVPAGRGLPRSRPFAAVRDEAERLVAAGHPELVLTGANLACYRDNKVDLVALTGSLAEIPGLIRLRLGSVEPATIEKSIIDLIASHPRICHSLHLPLQSGDNGVLRAMGRRYTAEEFARTIEYAATRIPGIGLGTDVITGLPGESEAAFQHTRDLIAALPLNHFHVFPYSERPGTRAVAMQPKVPQSIRKSRAEALRSLAETKRTAFARGFLNRTVDVLVERVSRVTARGWTSEYLPAEFHGENLPVPGQCVTGTVMDTHNETLICRVQE